MLGSKGLSFSKATIQFLKYPFSFLNSIAKRFQYEASSEAVSPKTLEF